MDYKYDIFLIIFILFLIYLTISFFNDDNKPKYP